MKGYVEQYAKGEFYPERPDVKVSIQSLQLQVEAGTVYKGSFTLSEDNDRKMKAMVYDDHYLFRFEQHIFVERTCQVNYSFDASHLTRGTVIDGFINVITDGGESKIPYHVQIIDAYIDTKAGEIKDMFRFTELAENDWNQALTVFASEDFKRTFLYDNQVYQKVYNSLIDGNSLNQALEEFLVFLHKKRAITISPQKNIFIYDSKNTKDYHTIVLNKNTWGHLDCTVTTDSRFIELTNKKITSEDFIANQCELPFFVLPDYLEEGNNSAHIFISNVYQTISIEIRVRKVVEKSFLRGTSENFKRKVKENSYSLIQNYLDFRIENINLDEYIEKTRDALNNLITYVPEEPIYRLGLLHMQILSGEKELALEECKRIEADSVNIIEGKQQACYYNYLKALLTRDAEVIDNAVHMIEQQMEIAQPRLFYFWLLMYLDNEYATDKAILYRKIEDLYNSGANSPVLYYEICDMMNNDPLILRKLGGLELTAIHWGMKNDFISREVLTTFVELAKKERKFRRAVFDTLTDIYDKYQDQECLKVICSLLIQAQKLDRAYHTYYAEAVIANIKLLGLNECFLRSMDFKRYDIIPTSVLLYMNYKNTLTEDEQAYLYANVVKNREAYGNIYYEYVDNIEAFMEEQIMKGVMSEDLSVIYAAFLEPEHVKSQYAYKLINIIFKRRLTCQNKNIKSVIVKHEELKDEVEVPLNGGVAYVEMITDSASIFLVDGAGNRYISTIPYRLEKLVEEKAYLSLCMKYSASDYRLILYLYENQRKLHGWDVKEINVSRDILNLTNISESTKQKALITIIDYYFKNYDEDIIKRYLMMLSINAMQQEKSAQYVTFFVQQGMYLRAYEVIKKYGYQELDKEILLKLVSYLVGEGGSDKDELIMSMCIYLYREDRYNAETIAYLVENYRGNMSDLGKLWRIAKTVVLDTRELEENTLAQYMFTQETTDVIYDMFASYYHGKYRGMVIKAFLKHTAYLYFIKEKIVPDSFFDILFAELEKGTIKDDMSNMAMLYYLSLKDRMDLEERNFVHGRVQYFVSHEKQLPFFKAFKNFVPLPEDLFVKTYLIFKSEPGQQISVTYRFGTTQTFKLKEQTMELLEIFPGLYMKEFVVFHGEKLLYEIEGDVTGIAKIIENDDISKESAMSDERSRFEQINNMLIYQEQREDEALVKEIENYLFSMQFFDENLKPM